MAKRDLAGYRSYAYKYTDLDDTDIDVELIDAWIIDGYRRIIEVVRRWQFFETTFDIVTVPGEREYPIPENIDDIKSMDGTRGPLDFLDYAAARERFHLHGTAVSQGHARVWTNWGEKIQIWPLPDAGETLTVVAWRKPLDWIAEGAGGVPDFPENFEDALLEWVVYRAHKHQDDTEMAAVARQDFQDRLDEMVANQIQKPSAFPLVMGGGNGLRAAVMPTRVLYPWE